jgi:hypothetical protein
VFDAAASNGDRFALLASGGFSAPSAGLALLDQLVVGSGDNPSVTAIDPPSAQPLFVVRSGMRELLGYRDLGAPNEASWLRVLDAAGLGEPRRLGCASGQEIPAHAIARGSGWWVAAAGSGTIPDPCVEVGPVGPAKRIGIARVDETGGATEIGSVDADYPLQHVRLTPSGDGAWLVYDHVVPGNILTAARLDASGSVVIPPFEVEPVVDAGFGVASLGDKLAIAWTTSLPGVTVALFDRDGSRLDEVSMPQPENASPVGGPPALIASASGDSLVLAWTHEGEVTRILVTRLDCTGTSG